MTLTVVMVDDHPLIIAGLRRALEAEDGFTVVGEAGSIAAALAVEEEHRPHVMLIDVNLGDPEGDGIDLVARLRAKRPDLGLVILTMLDDNALLLRALSAGASAYVRKTATTGEVVAALRHAASSPRSFSATGLAQVLASARSAPAGPALTDREREVLTHLATGDPVSTIARRLFLSTSTLKTHISRIYDKLGAGTRTEAVLTAIRLGLIQVDDPKA